jgi:hypothetical protein
MAFVTAACTALPPGLGGAIDDPMGGSPVPLDDGTGQELVRGTVVTPEGAPATDALVLLLANPTSEEQARLRVGDRLPQTSVVATRSGADGSFVLHLPPHPTVLANAAAENGIVNFDVQAFERWPMDAQAGVGFWAFPARLAADGTLSEVPAPVRIELARAP